MIVLGGAVVAALLTGSQVGQLNESLESVVTLSGTWLGRLAGVLPLGFAFGAGMVAAANPCGFALLPAYLGLYLQAGDAEASPQALGPRLIQALAVSATMTAGFVVVFGGAGLVLGAASTALARYFPWIGIAVGVVLALAGGRMLGGSMIYHSLGDRIAGRFGAAAQRRGPRGYFAYGLAYAAASLSCALPIFLAVVASALAAEGILSAAIQFVLYALGMGFVIAVLTAITAVVQHGALARARGLVRHVKPASAVLLLLAGGYVVYYWLTLGGILTAIGFSSRQ
jgi:cytochrome c biogenesis protein CcdA